MLAGELSRREGFAPALVGSPGEVGLCERVGAGCLPSLAGRLDLRQTLAFVGAADLVVCNSSFVLHAAAASRRPALALLGPAFDSASRHQRQWGYEGLTISLGREVREGRGVAEVQEAVAGLERLQAERAGAAVR